MWCRFHTGEKKKHSKNDRRADLRKNLDALKEIETTVDDCVTKMFAEASTKLVEFLNKNKSQKTIDVEDYEIPTAVVCCSFSHVNIFREALNLEEDIISINKDSNIRQIVESAKRARSGVFLIEQIESLSSEFIENLIYLSQWFELRFSFVICVSTGVSSFLDMCSLATLRSINAEVFHMPKPKEIYNNVMNCILQQCIEKQIYLSGEVYALLRSRYFCTSYSVQEIKRALRLFVQHNFWQLQQTSHTDEDEFHYCVEAYWANLKFYTEKCGLSLLECHEQIQTGAVMSRPALTYLDIVSWLDQEYVDKEVADKMRKNLRAYLEAKADKEPGKEAQKSDNDPRKSLTSTKLVKMSSVQLRQQMEAQRQAKLQEMQSNPENIFKSAVKDFVRSLLHPWSNFPRSEKYLITDEPKHVLYCDPAAKVEDSLLTEDHKMEPLSIAFRTLQQRPNWKSARISEWLKLYAKEVPEEHKENAVSSFYASVGQLESMGVIKAAGERKKDSILILHHPINHVMK